MPRRLACALSVTALAVAAVPAVAAATTAAEPGTAPVSPVPTATPTPSAAATVAQEPAAGEVTSFIASFTTKRPGASTGVQLRTTGAPPEPPAAVAPAIRQMVAFPAGTKLRAGALPQCDATDEMLAEQGAEAVCPAESRVGSGRAEGLLSRTVPVTFDLAVYAVRGRLYFAGERNGMPLKQGFFGIPAGRKLVLTVPTMNGAVAPTLFEAHIPAHPASSSWLRTPKQCPPSGRWIARGTFQGLTAPGGEPVGPAQRARHRMPCGA